MKRRITVLFAALAALTLALSPALAAKKEPRIDPKDFSVFVLKTLAEWKVPGVGIAVVKGEKIILAEGYGLRDVPKKLPVTPRTIFAIGSSSKAFTATALGILMDEGKLDWDKRVRDYLPTFRLQDESAAAQMTPRDLLCHRSGLARHDLAWIGSAFSRKELFDRMRFLEPYADFRSIFHYNNFMFMTAGQLAGEVTGSTWEDVVRSRIFEPLGMKDSYFSIADSRKKPDFSLPYGEKEDKVVELPFRDIDAMGPAGSINSNVLDMAQWLLLNLNKGKMGDKQVISEASLAEIHSPQMVIRDGAFRILEKFPEMFTSSYGMGWIITQYRGHTWIHHGGNVDGFTALVTFFPRDDIGVVVLSNMNGSFVPEIIALNVADRLLGLDQVPWSGRYMEIRDKGKAQSEKRDAEADKDRKTGTRPSHPLEDYAGEYVHPAYGPLAVLKDGDGLRMTRNGMTFTATHYHYDVFDISTEAIGTKLTFKASFALDLKGSVASVSVPFALTPGVKDIVFTRTPDKPAGGQAPAK
jgi:CubicO group peptidase (beta-lactamase class C family)